MSRESRAQKSSKASPEEALGEIQSLGSQVRVDNGGLKRLLVRLGRPECDAIAGVLDQTPVGAGVALLITAEQPSRLKFLAEPAPAYELRAARHRIRGELIRVRSTARWCRVSFTPAGALALGRILAAAAEDMKEWVELRVRVMRRGVKGKDGRAGASDVAEATQLQRPRSASRRPLARGGAAHKARHSRVDASQCQPSTRILLECVPDIEAAVRQDELRLGHSGDALAPVVWPVEDFSRWDRHRD